MNDIVKRLRRLGFILVADDMPSFGSAMREAAAEITRLRADLAAAQEREQRMREAGLLALKVAESWIHDQCDGTDALEPALAELDEARGTLCAMRGEP